MSVRKKRSKPHMMRGLAMQLRVNLEKAKQRFCLNRVMAKLDNTSGTVIAITFLVMNLAT
jgi:hypothetical protein